MEVAEAETWDVDISTVKDSDRTDDAGVWVCVDDLEPVQAELPKALHQRVTSKRRYDDDKMALLCYQDESIFRANDDDKHAWWAPDQHVVKKKSPGQGIMVSGTIIHNVGFASATKRQIKLAESRRKKRCAASAAAASRGGNVKVEEYRPIDKLYVDEERNRWSYHLFEYGKNKEGYWTGQKMLDHMSDVLDMLEFCTPTTNQSICSTGRPAMTAWRRARHR